MAKVTKPLIRCTGRGRAQSLIMVLSVAVIASCGGDGRGLDANGRPWWETYSSNTEIPVQATTTRVFNRIQDEILTPDCAISGCHSGTSSPLGLNLESGGSYDNLINQQSIQVSGLMLVEPSNVDASYLIQKLEGTQAGGMQMPLAKPPLSASKISQIRHWILDGATPPLDAPATLPAASGTDTPDNPISQPPPEVLATLSSIQSLIFNEKCVGCHSGDQPLGQLNLSEGQSYTQLVERPATMDPDAAVLVSIGNARTSFLIDKLRGERLGIKGEPAYRGKRMPVVGGYLDESTVQTIEAWINAGALEN